MVTSNTRGPGFDPSHRQLLLNIFTVKLFVEKVKIKEKQVANVPLKITFCSVKNVLSIVVVVT